MSISLYIFVTMKTEQRIFTELYERSGLTQVEFAERVGTDQPNISKLKNGRATPKLDTLEKYAEKLGYVIDVKVRKLMTIAVILLVSIAGHGQELSREAEMLRAEEPKYYEPIREMAVEQWGSDHQMVVYTINTQVESFFKWLDYYLSQESGTPERDILIKAMVNWNKGKEDEWKYDWSMVVYEFEKQIKAYKSY